MNGCQVMLRDDVFVVGDVPVFVCLTSSSPQIIPVLLILIRFKGIECYVITSPIDRIVGSTQFAH